MREAGEYLQVQGVDVKGLQIRTLWPVLLETLAFVESCERVYVVEHNASAQYRRVLAGAGAPDTILRSILRYDGLSFRPAELTARILEREEAAR
jgi:pyruvate/2-oxoacid:ferredoxin oxidoreductase alpha subunit